MQRQNSLDPEFILFWFVGKDFPILFVRKWTTWTGTRKRDNFAAEILPENDYKGIFGYQMPTIHQQN